jgi:DNA-binding transcriptional ArsR family regulator
VINALRCLTPHNKRGKFMSGFLDAVPFDGREDNINKAATALKAMAHPLRLKILCVIGSEEVPVMDIVDQVGTTQSNVSQHIDILREKGIIVSRREGSKILCRIKDAELLALMDAMQQTFCRID